MGTGALLYRDVAEKLTQRILTKVYPVGTALPREVDLMVELGVSRNTLREALRLLEADSLIERRKRRGTIVCRSDLQAPRRLSYDPASVVGGLGQTTRFVVSRRGRRNVPRKLVPEATGDGFANWLHFAGIRHSLGTNQALCVSEFFLHPRLQAVAGLVGKETGLIYRLIERECGERMRRVHNTISPCRISRAHGAIIGVPAGTLGIEVVRRISNEAGELLEIVHTVCPASRITFEIEYAIGPD